MPRAHEEWIKKDRCIWFCPERNLYRVDVNRQGKRRRASFSSLARARRFRDAEENAIRDTGDLSTETQLRDMTLGHVVQRYLHERVLKGMDGRIVEISERMNAFEVEKKTARREGRPPKQITDEDLPQNITTKRALEHFLNIQENDLCKVKILQLTGRRVLIFLEQLFKTPWFGPNSNWKKATYPCKRTVERNFITPLRNAFEYLRLDFPQLNNPFSASLLRNVDAPRSSRVVRSLQGNELERLLDACSNLVGSNRLYMPVAIYMAHELGMRRQEILNLRASDIDESEDLITIRKSKTDKRQDTPGRIIPLTESVSAALSRLEDFVGSQKDGSRRYYRDDEKIFGVMSINAFEKAWANIRRNAKLDKPFAFQDLRVTAINRFDKILTPTQIRIVVGHKGKNITEGYIDRGITHEDRMAVKRILDIHSKGWEKINELDAWPNNEYEKLSVPDVIRILSAKERDEKKGL
jgi:integrase